MKLEGKIAVRVEVGDFAEAGDHQRTLEAFLQVVREQYPQATLEFTQRRERRPLGLVKPEGPDIGPRAYGVGGR
jgi:hypothetical protein